MAPGRAWEACRQPSKGVQKGPTKLGLDGYEKQSAQVTVVLTKEAL